MRKALAFVAAVLFVFATCNITYSQENAESPTLPDNIIYSKLDSQTIGVMPTDNNPNNGVIILREFSRSHDIFVYVDKTAPVPKNETEFMAILSMTSEKGEPLNVPVFFLRNDQKDFPRIQSHGFVPLMYDCYIDTRYSMHVGPLVLGTLNIGKSSNALVMICTDKSIGNWGLWYLLVFFIAIIFVNDYYEKKRH